MLLTSPSGILYTGLMIEMQEGIKARLKAIEAALDQEPGEMNAYRLRTERYNLLRSNGVKAKRTYPHGPLAHIEDFKPTHVTPISIRFHGGKSIGRTAVTLLAKAAA